MHEKINTEFMQQVIIKEAAWIHIKDEKLNSSKVAQVGIGSVRFR